MIPITVGIILIGTLGSAWIVAAYKNDPLQKYAFFFCVCCILTGLLLLLLT